MLEMIKEEFHLTRSFKKMINMRALNWSISLKDFRTRLKLYQWLLTINCLLLWKKMENAAKFLILKQELSFESSHSVKVLAFQTWNLCLVFSVLIESSYTLCSLRKEQRPIWPNGKVRMANLTSNIQLQSIKVQATTWSSHQKDFTLLLQLMI